MNILVSFLAATLKYCRSKPCVKTKYNTKTLHCLHVVQCDKKVIGLYYDIIWIETASVVLWLVCSSQVKVDRGSRSSQAKDNESVCFTARIIME